jgi:putative aldouronate transport system substrate-binding protein
MKKKPVLFLLIVTVLSFALLTACSGVSEVTTTLTTKASESPTTTSASLYNADGQYIGEPKQAVYPLKSAQTKLTIYMKDASNGIVGNWGNIKAFQVAGQKLGVTLEFIHPTVGSEADQFNLMIASQELPDVIAWDFSTTPMGLAQLVTDGILLDMDNKIREYAPNFLKVLNSNPKYKKEALSNEGHYLALPSYNEGLPVSGGPTIRGDLLKKYSLTVPVTVDDWTQVMTALKEKDSAVKYPLTTGKGRDGSVWFDIILPAYNTAQSFCLDDKTGAVVYGPSTANFKSYLTKLNEWYAAGLIDPEFMSNDGKSMNAKLTDGTCVAGSLQLNMHIMSITKVARATNPDFAFEGATWPVLKKGDKPSLPLPAGLTYSGGAAALTSDCKDPVMATQVLDFFYSKEGNDLLSWGIENESYKVNTDGTKTFTDKIMNNPDKKSPAESILAYAIPLYGFSDVIQTGPWAQIATQLPEQAVARSRWIDAGTGVNMPKLSVAANDQRDFSMIMNEVNTYTQEMYIKFITGQANLSSDWDTYVNTLKGMKLETATGYMAAVYKLYQTR